MNMAKLITPIFILALMVSLVLGKAKTKTVPENTLRFAYSSSTFTDVNLKDAKVAMELLTSEIAKQLLVNTVPKTTIFTNINMLITALKNKEVDMAALSAVDYLRNKNKLNIEPALIGISNQSYGKEFIVLVHNQSGIKNLKQLINKKVIVPKSSEMKNLIFIWLQNLFIKNKVSGFKRFYDQINFVEKPSQAILPVFFRQADACIVSNESFKLLIELNPQLGRDLAILKRSPVFITNFFGFRKDLNENIKKMILEKAHNLQYYPAGKQILMLFKLDRIVPFKREYLDNVAQLIKLNK
ncbi:MAG TPA: transporter substrate-binding domain-containing protein [Bacteroidetes bacterium]|nr:transporter substrate-binding domain-containing protein [Bacteroidota bacterium]